VLGGINPLRMSRTMGRKVKGAIVDIGVGVEVKVEMVWGFYEQHPPPSFPWPCLSRLTFGFAPGVAAAESINFFLISLHAHKS